MCQHEHYPQQACRLKQHHPHSVAKQKNAKNEFNQFAGKLEVVNDVIRSVRKDACLQVEEDKKVQSHRDTQLDEQFTAKCEDGEKPGGEGVVEPVVENEVGGGNEE